MEARKIKEWHLDPELLQRLATGGTIDISSVMSDYLKKTDVIRKAQLDDAIFTEITNDINAVQSLLDNYRKKQNQITAADLDTELTHRLEELETKINTLLAESGTSVDIETLVNEAIAAQLTNSVSETVNTVLDSAINTILDDRLEPTVNALFTDQLNNTINSSVQTVLNESEALASMRSSLEEMQNTVDGIYQQQDTVDNTLTEHGERLDTIEESLENDVRKKDDLITEEDLSESISDTLNQLVSNVETLQEREYLAPVYGSNKSYIRLQNGNLIASDIIRILNVCNTADEVLDSKNQAIDDIYDIINRKHYFLELTKWNKNSKSNIKTLVKQQEGEPEEEIPEEPTTGEEIPTGEEPDSGESSTGEPTSGDSSEEEPIVDDPVEEEPTPVILTYATYTLTDANVVSELTLSFDNNVISGINSSEIDVVPISFGFYGTRLKVTIPAGTEQELSITIDDSKIYSLLTDAENDAYLQIEYLSEGPHRIDINILPGAEFIIDANVEIDDTHAVLMPKEDIKPVSFYQNTLYDTIDYLTDTNAYDTYKSENVQPFSESLYTEEDIDLSEFEKDLVLSAINGTLFYCINDQYYILTANSGMDNMSEEEAAAGIATTAKTISAKVLHDTVTTISETTAANLINSVPDTKNTAGSMNNTSKLFLIGAMSQTTDSQTYSHANVYETNGDLHANSLDINGNIVVNGTEGTNYIQLPSGIQLF